MTEVRHSSHRHFFRDTLHEETAIGASYDIAEPGSEEQISLRSDELIVIDPPEVNMHTGQVAMDHSIVIGGL